MQIQVLGTSLTQMSAPQAPVPVQTQVRRSEVYLPDCIQFFNLSLNASITSFCLFAHITDNNEDAFQCRAQQRSKVCVANMNGLFSVSLSAVFVNIIFLYTLHCRMLEQLRKQQGSVLHPNYSAPFHSVEDTLHRLLPYHLYQGTANSSQDYQRGNEHPQFQCSIFMPFLLYFFVLMEHFGSFVSQWMMNLRRSPASC